jgi:small subunit ribosomal protein S4
MGDPRKIRKKYQKPGKRWEKGRIDEERPTISSYGLKNKKELWKMAAILRSFMRQAKGLEAAKGSQADREKQQLFSRLRKYGLLKENATLDDVLGLTLGDILERRLQTLVYKKGFARTINQARQMIVHEHVMVAGRKMTSPSYLVPTAEEAQVAFAETSQFNNMEHAERSKPAKVEKKKPRADERPRRRGQRGRQSDRRKTQSVGESR